VSSKNSKANRIETGERSGGIRRNLFGGSRRKIAKKIAKLRLRAHVCRGDARHGYHLHCSRGCADTRCSGNAEPAHRLTPLRFTRERCAADHASICRMYNKERCGRIEHFGKQPDSAGAASVAAARHVFAGRLGGPTYRSGPAHCPRRRCIHILRCLGAAVIMQWNDLPTKIQRELA
jgi:hypothetical protein